MTEKHQLPPPGINYFAIRCHVGTWLLVVGAMTAIEAKETAAIYLANEGKGSYSVQSLEAQHIVGGILYALSVRPRINVDSSSLAPKKRARKTGKRHSGGNRK
jgi:hypothetical protein